MNVEELREYCIKKAGATESFPFDDTALVFKVGEKMFALLSLKEEPWLNLKCDPEYAISLREEYDYIRPGYHMNKKHWNTIDISDAVDSKLLKQLVDDSYQLVYDKLPKKIKDAI